MMLPSLGGLEFSTSRATTASELPIAIRGFKLGHDASLRYVLADIPFFCVGILALGVITFFFTMRRVDRLLLCIHVSVFFAFVGSLFDLAQILVRGPLATDAGKNISNATGLIAVREVAYSLSFGFRYLWFWGFVALPPRGEVPPNHYAIHSGSWVRWGVIGILLKWFLFCGSIAIPVLQILYRNIKSLNKFGPVYEVEGTLQVVVSALLIAKLLLNTWVAILSDPTVSPRWRTFRDYLPVITALLLNGAVGVGNILSFEFSETILGHFLQAIELYIVLVYVLTAAFYHMRHFPSLAEMLSSRTRRISSFQGLPTIQRRESTFRITPPSVSIRDFTIPADMPSEKGVQPPPPSQWQPESSYAQANGLRPPVITSKRGSATSRISSWLNSRNFSGRIALPSSGPDKYPLWNQDQAERGTSPVGSPTQYADYKMSPTERSPTEPYQSAKWQDPMFTAILHDSPPPLSVVMNRASEVSLAQAVEQGGSVYLASGLKSKEAMLPPLAIPPRALSRPFSGESPLSGSPKYPKESEESPIFGLNGIVRSNTRESEFEPRASAHWRSSDTDSARSSGISKIIRQQNELEKSIAALRIFSVDSRLSGLTSSDGEGQYKPSSSAESEFSLSNFPVPPWGRASIETNATVRPSIPQVLLKPASVESEHVSRVDPPNQDLLLDLLPPKMSATMGEHSRNLSVPYSDDGNDLLGVRPQKVSSSGTQYEITSFIGNLTHKKEASTSSESIQSQAQAQAVTAIRSSLKTARPTFVPSSSPLRNPLNDDKEIVWTPPQGASLSNTEKLEPPAESSTAAIGLTRASIASTGQGLFAPLSGRNRAVGLPPRPRLPRGERLPTLEERMSPSDEYERPRPAPLPASVPP